VSIAVADARDLVSDRFSLRVSQDGSTIWTKSPLLPQFQLEDWENNFHNKDGQTKMGHSTTAATFQNLREEERTEIVEYKLPEGYTVTTRFWNGTSNPTLSRDGCFRTQWQWISNDAWLIQPDPNATEARKRNGVMNQHSLVYWELAIVESVRDTVSDEADNVAKMFEQGLNLGKNLGGRNNNTSTWQY
jgi:hypothetical protein